MLERRTTTPDGSIVNGWERIPNQRIDQLAHLSNIMNVLVYFENQGDISTLSLEHADGSVSEYRLSQ